MIYSNTNKVKSLKMWLLIAGLSCILVMTVLIFLERFYILAILTGFFLLGLIIIGLLNFQFIRIVEEKDRLIIRYFSVFSIDRNYSSIEFPVANLHRVRVRKYLFGLKWDLKLTVKVRHGIAEYPSISLSAVSFKERRKLLLLFEKLIKAN